MERSRSGGQSISFLMRRFAEAGIRVKHKHGQNFLIDLNLLRMIVDAAELTADDVVLEIGAGCGSLTGLLAERGRGGVGGNRSRNATTGQRGIA